MYGISIGCFQCIVLCDLNCSGEVGDGEVAAKELVQQELECSGAEPERKGRHQQHLRHEGCVCVCVCVCVCAGEEVITQI